MSKKISLPVESKQLIINLSQEYSRTTKELLKQYINYYNQEFIRLKVFMQENHVVKRHKWARDFLELELSYDGAVDKHNIIPFGKSPIADFEGQDPSARMWVLDLTLRKKAVLDIPKIVLQFNILDDFQLFAKYPDVPITSAYSGYLKTNHKILPLPSPELSSLTAHAFMKKLCIPTVKMSDTKFSDVFSSMTNKGYYLASDIRCIPNCRITYSKRHDRELDDYKYQIGNISITDHTTDGFVTDGGLVIPSYFFCWVHPDFVYNVDSIGDAYGVLKIKTNDKIAFECCYFDILEVGEEPEKEKRMN